MLSAIVEFAIRRRGLVAGLAVVITLYGLYRMSRAGLDIFPEFSPKAVIVQTEAPGLSSAQVEILVTTPLETALAGLIGLEHVRSESIAGLSIVTAVFNEDTDLIRARQFVSERLTTVREALPPSAIPTVVPLASSSATVRTIGIQSDKVDLTTLRAIVDRTLLPALLAVPGVADINVFGGGVGRIEVEINPAALWRYELGVNALASSLQGAHDAAVPLGFSENSNQRLTLELAASAHDLARLRALPIATRQGHTLTVGEVAEVRFGAAPAVGAAQINGKPAVVLMIIGQYGANTLTVSNALREVLAGFTHTLGAQGITLFPELFVPANYIETSLANISEHLLIGALFVVVILLLFLFDLRAAFISAVAIPLSLLSALLVLIVAGVNLNIMVMGGLAIALGEVVDDAIIDTENIYRRLRENQAAAVPRPAHGVIYDAALEVRGSVVYASFIVALVFVPLLTLSGVAGRLFAPLGATYILAILASLAVALTVTPALSALLLNRARWPAHEPPLTRWLQRHYRALVRRLCQHTVPALSATALACALLVALLPTLNSHFLPPLREGHYILHTTGLPGASLTESIRLGTRLSEEIRAVPGVRSVSQWAGRAARGADTYGPHYSEYEIALDPMAGRAQQTLLDRIRRIVARFPGVRGEVNTFLIERVDETIAGYAAPVVVNIYGHDFAALDLLAREVNQLMSQIEGAAEVQTRAAAQAPVLQVDLVPAQLIQHGVLARDALLVMQTAYNGHPIGTVLADDRPLDLVLTAPADIRRETAAQTLPVTALDGHVLPLGALVTTTEVDGRYNILHRGGLRVQTVTANVTRRALSAYWAELARRLKTEITVPSEMKLELTGAAVEAARARTQLLVDSMLAGCGVLALIAIALGRFRYVVMVLANLPFALAGGVIAVVVTQGTLSIGSVVGFVTLFGITVRNSIMLIAHYTYLVQVEGRPWSLDTVVQGAAERLPSIAITALVTALAMLPIALNSDNAGREIMGPMAAIIIGGLVSSAILNLLIMPALMWRFGRFDVDRRRISTP